MLDPSSEGSKSSTPTNDTKSKSRGAQVYVPRHRREADGKPQTTDDNVKKLDERDSIRDSDNRDTPLNNEPLKKNSEAKTTPIKEPHSSTPSTPSTPLTPSSPLTGTPPKPQIQVQSQTQTPKSKSKSTPTKPESETKNSSEKKTSKPKAKTVIVPLSLLDISDNTPQKEESIKPKCGPQKVTLSLTDVGPDGQSPATTPSKSTTNPPSAPTTPSSTTPKRAPPIHSISLVDNSVSPQILSRKEAPKVEKDASTNSVTIDNTNKNTSDNNGKEGEAESGSEEEWESNWEATLETWKSTTTTTTKPTEPASVRRTSSELGTKSEPAAVRGRGRKKFDDDGAEIGTSHPDLDGPSSGSSLSSNRDSSLSASSDSAITSVDRTDAQKQFSHILEIYSFPLTATTEHLNDYLKDYASLYRLKWVNDTSALAIFKNAKYPSFAADALAKIGNSKYKMRVISEASDESLATASRSLGRKVEEKSTPRPYQTTTTVARRLIANALNMSFKPAANDNEVEQLRETKRKMWEDDDV